ncbi:MAG: hypothetical protein ACXW2E_01770 [Nitrososphaeraceae archaeon]
MSKHDIYVSLPEYFIAVPYYPGYFFHIKEQHLYSIKTGELKRLKLYLASPYRMKAGYNISTKGIRRTISQEYLHRLSKTPHKSTIKKQK